MRLMCCILLAILDGEEVGHECVSDGVVEQ